MAGVPWTDGDGRGWGRGIAAHLGGEKGENVLWRSPLPATAAGGEADHNQSSPVVSDGKVFVTTAFWPPGADRTSRFPEHRVTCYHAADGSRLWDVEVKPGEWLLGDLRGGYAAPTPAVAGGRVFAVFGSAVVHALDLEGRPLWSYRIPDHERFDVALPSSPVVAGDSVILQLDRKKPGATMVALDAATGELRWTKARPDCDFSHVTPVLAELGGGRQLLTPTSEALLGVDPADGATLWSCAWGRTISPVSSPVVADGLVFAVGGRGGHPGVVVDPTGRGDVTGTHLKWAVRPMSEGLSSPVAFGGLVFRLNSPGVLRCLRIADGEELYRERLEGVDPAVSPIVTADGRIYFASAGGSVVVRASPRFEVLGRSDLGDASLASAAVAGGRIYLKGRTHLYAVGYPETSTEKAR